MANCGKRVYVKILLKNNLLERNLLDERLADSPLVDQRRAVIRKQFHRLATGRGE